MIDKYSKLFTSTKVSKRIMISSDNTTWLNTKIGVIGIAVGIIGIMVTIIATALGLGYHVRGDILGISTVLLIVAFILLFKQIPLPKQEKVPTPITNFTAQLGNKNNPGFLLKKQRLDQLQPGQNPYICGAALPGNSAVFYGRIRELAGTMAVLNNKDEPGNISILGERRIGKSSLLNQIYQELAAASGVITIHTTMQNWSINSQASFFTQLHKAICEALQIQSGAVDNYTDFRDFIRDYAKQGYRFVLMIDEFELMTDNVNFNAEFFGNMRTLGGCPEYKFAYVLASRESIYGVLYEKTHLKVK